MIYYRTRNQDIDSLMGKIIFHSSVGSNILTSLPNQIENRIGKRLGKVVRNAGDNRIFYQTSNNDEKYVSIAGIGFICDTESDALVLEGINENQIKSVFEFVRNAQIKMLKQIQENNETQNGAPPL